ncbi:MAG: hypothetical protein R2852_04520 [Bacteroidia bacterium]
MNKPYKIENIENSAHHAGANDFIEKLPQQYESILGRLFDDGNEISIGQWQKSPDC